MSGSSHEQTMYGASSVKYLPLRPRKGPQGQYQLNIVCKCPLVTTAWPVARPGAGAVTAIMTGDRARRRARRMEGAASPQRLARRRRNAVSGSGG